MCNCDFFKFQYSSRPPQIDRDGHSIFTYYVEMADRYLGYVLFYFVLSTVAIFLIGTRIYISEMVEDLQTALIELNGDDETIKKRLSDAICFHGEVVK